jgi:hypothetical protein
LLQWKNSDIILIEINIARLNAHLVPIELCNKDGYLERLGLVMRASGHKFSNSIFQLTNHFIMGMGFVNGPFNEKADYVIARMNVVRILPVSDILLFLGTAIRC